jgi:hypothetical protein
MPLTLEQMVEEVKGAVGDSGTCDFARATTYINRARRLLWEKREWNATSEYFCICCVDSCFILPPRYGQIRAAWVNNEAASLADEWYNLTPNAKFVWQNSCHRQIIEVGGKHVLFRDYLAKPYQIAVMVESSEDVGLPISFEALSEYGGYDQATAITIPGPNIAKTEKLYTRIRSVSKPKTKGRIRVFAYDPSLDIKTLISLYQPGDVNPSWRKFKAPRGCNCITIYASKTYADLSDPQELVEFTPEAMYFALLAINARENRQDQEFLTKLSLAVQEEEKAMEGDEIPTASPPRFMDYRRPDNLIHDTFLSRGTMDYLYYP